MVIGKVEAGIGFIDGLWFVNGYSGPIITYITGLDYYLSYWR
jgi:hypothetical protein